jgi:hypothetical protein
VRQELVLVVFGGGCEMKVAVGRSVSVNRDVRLSDSPFQAYRCLVFERRTLDD